jgi:hypothetical protein
MNAQTDKNKPKPAEAPKGGDVALRQTGTDMAVADFGSDAGAGMENVQAGELKIPFLTALDAKSPQCAPPARGGVPGAVQGMMMNKGTGELYDGDEAGGVVFVPVHRDHNYVEFTPQNLGGGFVAVHSPDDPKILEMRAKQGKFGKLYSVFPPKRDDQGNVTEGTEIIETYYLYGLVVDQNGGTSGVIVPFKSTQIAKYQAFMQRQTSFKYKDSKSTDENPLPPVQPPIYAHRWRLSTVPENKKTFNWWGWTLSLAEKEADGRESPYFKSLIPTSSQLYKDAQKFREMIVGGAAKADFKQQSNEEPKEEVPM